MGNSLGEADLVIYKRHLFEVLSLRNANMVEIRDTGGSEAVIIIQGRDCVLGQKSSEREENDIGEEE
jgi:hypothetical protein